MLASAVVVPEDPPSPSTNSSPSLKRRQSSPSPSTEAKRPRLDSSSASQNHTNGSGSPPLPVPIATSPPPPADLRRKSSATQPNTEERKRTQRLFGSLLGTLSQSTSKPAHRRVSARDEIDRRQQEKLRRNDEELEEEKRRRREELDKARATEQTRWDAKSTRLRHETMRAKAGFLQTKAEPVLYYRPWELRTEEEGTVKRQREEVEKVIRDEIAEKAAQGSRGLGLDGEMRSPVANEAKEGLEVPGDESMKNVSDPNGTENAVTNGKVEIREGESEEIGDETKSNGEAEPKENIQHDEEAGTEIGRTEEETNGTQNTEEQQQQQQPSPRHNHRDDNNHEELVEGHGQEDDVIY